MVYYCILNKNPSMAQNSLRSNEEVNRASSFDHYKTKLYITTSGGSHIIEKNTILYLKSDSNYCEILVANGQKFLCSKTLKSFEKRLHNKMFIRVHNSYTVNVQHITFIDRSFSTISLHDGSCIPIARSQRKTFQSFLETYFD